MKRLGILLAMVALVGVIYETNSFAQKRMGRQEGGGVDMGAAHKRMYDPKTVETIGGEVISIEKTAPGKGTRGGMHLMVKTDKETITVYLGPSRYIEDQDVKIAPKDKLDIKGSRIVYQEKPVLIASEVKKGDKLLKLRDENGTPLWRGGRRK